MIKEERTESIDYQAYLAKWHFLWAYGQVIKKIYIEEEIYKKLINRLIDGKFFLKGTSFNFINHWFKEISKIIKNALDDEYANFEEDQKTVGVASIKSFNFKNWIRNQDALKKLKRKLDREIDEESFPIDQ